MGTIHDDLAVLCGDDILSKIRQGDPDFKQIFSDKMIRSADWDWPRPDYVCVDEELECSYAIEFKPPFQTKREYLTGLGQAISYLQKHLYSGLVVPRVSDDGFQISKFISDTLTADEFKDVAVSLYDYDPSDVYAGVNILRGIDHERVCESINAVTGDKAKTFWCWWRECSQYELLDLLELAFRYNDKEGDIYTTKIYPDFHERLVDKKTYKWDGKPRNKKDSAKSAKSEKQNYKIPLTQLELWNEGHLTDLGFKMLQIGKKYGANSTAFMDAFGYLLLVNGRHLELIKRFERYQKEIDSIADTSPKFLLQIEDMLTADGCIGARKPGEVTTGKKQTYIRDEGKLWNKFGIVENVGNTTHYYFKGEGYRFDWHKISDILISGSQLLN